MKYNGEEARFTAKSEIRLPRPGGKYVVFQATALPIGWPETLESKLVQPVAETSFVRKDGKLARENGKAIPYEDTGKPKYRKELAMWNRRTNVLTLYQSVRDDPNCSFDNKESDFGSCEEFCDAIWQEMEHAGFSYGDMLVLNAQINRLSNIDLETLEAAAEGFTDGHEAQNSD